MAKRKQKRHIVSEHEGFTKVAAGELDECFTIFATTTIGTPLIVRGFDREIAELKTRRMNEQGALADLHRQKLNRETMLWESVEMLIIGKVFRT